MKTDAVRFVKPGQLDITQIEVPDLGPGQVLVEVKANGICRGDINFFAGRFKRPFPFFFGHEPSGIVAEVGAEVKGLEPGDKVALLGSPSMMRHHVAASSLVIKIPDQSVEDLATWISEPVGCAVNGVQGSGFKAGDKVALLGCGYMGLLVLQGMPRETFSRLIVADPNEKSLALARAFGAEETYNPDETDLPALAEEMGGFDVVVEASGAKGTLSLATDMLRRGGTLNIFGCHVEEESVPTVKWHMMGLKVLNTAPGFADDFLICFRAAVALMAKGRINQKPLISHRFPFSESQKALEVAAAGGEGYIKGVITF